MEHTPGPWAVLQAYQGEGKDAPIIRCEAGGYIARLFHPDAMSGLTSLAPDRATAEANARLIAAAPDLLAALEAAYEEMQTVDENLQEGKETYILLARMEQAFNAITKARG